MLKKWNQIHAYLINPLINLLSLLLINIWYDNFTYIANTLHLRFYVLLWACSTLYGFLIYPLQIWDTLSIPYNKKRHALYCLGMLICVFIPYFPSYPFWINDLHVWLFIFSFGATVYEWLKTLPVLAIISKKWCIVLITTFLFCLMTYIWLGHMTGFTESLASISLNIVLYLMQKNLSI